MDKYLNRIICGDCLSVMKGMPDNSIHSIVTDPPYGLKFMGKKWDYDVPSVEIWQEALRVLKPGGHVLSFGGTRTYHRMVVNIEDAGFEIRDQILWLYGSGFPKSLDVSKAIDKAAGVERKVIGEKKLWGHNAGTGAASFSKNQYEGQTGITRIESITAPATPEAQQWEGWGTALKPAVECICLARKPLDGTVANNVLTWGTGGMNIDGCRIEGEYKCDGGTPGFKSEKGWNQNSMMRLGERQTLGRFPANVILDEEAGKVLDLQSGELSITGKRKDPNKFDYANPLPLSGKTNRKATEYPGDSGGASRFFYCAKASASERGEYNDHPTVKPIDLIRYLIRLITPPDGIVLDMFGGTGTTALAAIEERVNYIVIEKDQHNVEDISERRIAEATRQERMF